MSHTGAACPPPGPHRRRSIFRDDSPDTEPRDPWAAPVVVETATEIAMEIVPAPDPGPAPPGTTGRRSIFRPDADRHDGPAR